LAAGKALYDARKDFQLLVSIPASDAARRSGAGGGGVNTVAFASNKVHVRLDVLIGHLHVRALTSGEAYTR
jgi:hypothetical protein